MTNFFALAARAVHTLHRPLLRYGLVFLLLLLLLAGRAARAQTWTAATAPNPTQTYGTSQVRGVAADASGNVFVTGSYTGQVSFGSTTLTSAGSNDIFVAKYVPGTGTWAWVQTAGGTYTDQAYGIAVSGSSIYVTGIISNSPSDACQVRFGGNGTTAGTARQNGIAINYFNSDLVLAKYTDNGTTATFNWSQVAGGTGSDQGLGVAVNGTSVYVTGYFYNNTANASGVLLGSSGTTTGTAQQNGATTTTSNDLLLAKYTDNGNSATFGWSQVAGGTGSDQGQGVAVSGSTVYVTGYLYNTTANANGVLLGGSGTAPGTVQQYGTSATASNDLLLAAYSDQGSSATLAWTQAAGGTGDDQGTAVAVGTGGVYVAGNYTNDVANSKAVVLGASGTTAGTRPLKGLGSYAYGDIWLLKYTDNASSATLGWAQIGGGTQYDYAYGVAVSGSRIYLAGYMVLDSFDSYLGRLGGDGTTAGTVVVRGATATSATADVLAACYTDNGPTATANWGQAGGGTQYDYGYGIALSGSTVVVGGYLAGGGLFSFGPASTAAVLGTPADNRAVLGKLDATDGTWQSVSATTNGGQSQVRGVALDAAGNLFVTGYFSGIVSFGATQLVSAGGNDLFVAKYVPGTATWAWAQRAGGASEDNGYGVAVSGTSIYVTGSYATTSTNNYAVSAGGPTPASSASAISGVTTGQTGDFWLLKYTDAGSTGSYRWAQVGGGSNQDQGTAVAASGTSVYVAANFINTTTNSYGGLLGGDGTTAGTVRVNGATATASQDLLLVKYTDNGSTGSLVWNQVGGGTGYDYAYGLALSGTGSVYVAGSIYNTLANANAVVFGGGGTTTGTAAQAGASSTVSYDLLLAKYTDNGTTATFGWSQVGGGTGQDQANGVAVSGTSVYVTGYLTNSLANTSAVLLGGSGTTPGTVQQNGASTSNSQDLLLAKYADNGATATFGWSQVGGGTQPDAGTAVAVNGLKVYVTGYFGNSQADATLVRFGGSGTRAGATVLKGVASNYFVPDLLLARYTDFGATARVVLAQAAGGNQSDYGYGLAVSGTTAYVAGLVQPTATFGSTTFASPALANTAALATLADAAPLPVELSAFTATAEGTSAVHLAWTTASEKNSAYFEVERSTDGEQFAPIGTVAAAGSSSTAHAYKLLDAKLPAGVALLYYRLRQTDSDGTFAYSPVRTVALTGVGAGLALYPNPAPGGAATLAGALPGAVVTVHDALGRSVTSALTDASGTAALVLPAGTPAGVYVVRAGTRALRLTVAE
ncbi:beta strand repeat-containing protein [Hymenobacter negativus]|uniref:T9SS type A sorting domain-containing protein n=1 Tax=Hymenobacter negativus TaxID=2795026 RepID=A0ABS3Q924_9BACT|nr:hypothetical protein [Hymenobacter negativus]MBO2007712.1 hypothetical protein [Hymenobacter negativus]